MPSLKLHGTDRQMSELSVEELQSNIAACQLMFPKWKSGYQVILAGACNINRKAILGSS